MYEMIKIRYRFGRNMIEFISKSDLESDLFKSYLNKFDIEIISIERLLELE